MWTLVCIALLISLFLYQVLVNTLGNKRLNKIPGPNGVPILGNGFDFLMSTESVFYYFRYLANKYKNIFEISLANNQYLVLLHPEDVETVISSTKHNEKGYLYSFLRAWLHDGLLLSSGKKWHQRRKILTPAFHFKILRHFNSILSDKSAKLAEKLRSEVNRPKTNIYSFITDFTINSICETAMGTALDEESSTVSKSYKKAIHELGIHIFYRSIRIWLHPESIFNLSQLGRAHRRTLNFITSFRDCVVKQRRQNEYFDDLYTKTMNESGDDDDFFSNDKKRLAMLDLLLHAEKQGFIDSEGINEEVDTFMFEGHDTTATALQFAFMLLANNPNVQDMILEEYFSILGSCNRKPTLSDLSEMKYLEACIKESLRLYPPVYFIERKCDGPLILRDSERLTPSGITILIFDLHRRSDQFVEALEFRPERFLKEPTWHPFSYLPFSAGPRNCIGQKFAMMEMKLAITAVLSNYRLLPVTKPQDIVFVTDILLRTRDPIFVKFEKRQCRHITSNNILSKNLSFTLLSESVFYYFRYMVNKYKDIFEINLGNQKIFVLAHPKDVEAVISSTKHNNKGYLYGFLRPWLHDGLLLSSGKKWHQRRKILTPAFHFKILRHFNSVLCDKSAKLAEKLQYEVNRPKTNINSFITDFTINSICETAMGTALDEESSTVSKSYKKAIHELGIHIFYRSIRIWLHPESIFNLSQLGRAHRRTLNFITSFRDCVVKQRRQNEYFGNLYTKTMNESSDDDDDYLVNNKNRLAMLDLLLHAEKQGLIDSEGINEEVDTFMFEGHDTTATALQFAFMLLANNTHVQDMILEEYSSILSSSNRKPTLSDLSNMKYLEACIKESLRLYPPVYFIERKCDCPLTLRGIEMPAPINISISILDIHRRSDQFVEALEFRPERFLKEPTWHPFAYLPFSAGPRNCIGQKFAMMEMKLAITAVLSNYRLLPVTKPQDIVFVTDVILRTRDPIFIKFEKR
ncbi:cytochrome P450 4C1 [Bicyclus anynana]|uniref:Cytochrome P450 4C1 n=1 Tax=Bicyclus anynana TaxID=110368 RepID=A0ABM3LFJ7_BICAN|nr:cytochrome P450 4C1 [Bicyclus anynana]